MNMRLTTPGLLRINRFLLSLAVSIPALSGAQSQNYPGPTYQQPASTPSTGKLQVLTDKVAQISANDQRQDIRLYQLEREVDKVSSGTPKPPPSPETGTSATPKLIPYVPYQVRKGDTLWRIAMNHRVSPGDIINFNRLPNETVVENQVLMIPQKAGGKSATPSAPVAFHTVLPNENFHSIGKKYGITSDAVAKANPKTNPAKLMAGARLAIPTGAKLPPVKAHAQLAYDHGLPAPKPAKTNVTHIVQSGESLSVIAQKHKVTTASVQTANGITNPNAVTVGQKLLIPGGSKVVSQQVANKKPAPAPPPSPPPAGTGVANTPNLPTPPAKPTPPTPPQSPVQNNRGVVAYRMDKGDTVDSVAQMFGTTGAEIRRLNRLTTTSPLYEGDEILVPGMGPVAGN